MPGADVRVKLTKKMFRTCAHQQSTLAYIVAVAGVLNSKPIFCQTVSSKTVYCLKITWKNTRNTRRSHISRKMSLDLGIASASKNQQRYAGSQPYSRWRIIIAWHERAQMSARRGGQLRHRVIRNNTHTDISSVRRPDQPEHHPRVPKTPPNQFFCGTTTTNAFQQRPSRRDGETVPTLADFATRLTDSTNAQCAQNTSAKLSIVHGRSTRRRARPRPRRWPTSSSAAGAGRSWYAVLPVCS